MVTQGAHTHIRREKNVTLNIILYNKKQPECGDARGTHTHRSRSYVVFSSCCSKTPKINLRTCPWTGGTNRQKEGSICLTKITDDTIRDISGDVTCSKSISCAIIFTEIWIVYCLLDNRHATYLSTLCPPPVRERENARFYFGYKLWWNIPHC